MTALDLIVFSDLDGTLLDHATYDWSPARPALDRLAALDVPVVLASSKTAAEIAPLRREMGLERWPAIVENGAGLLPAGQGADAPGPEYPRLRAVLKGLPETLRAGFEGFGDWSDAEVARRTGLPPESARLARIRAFSEPGIWGGDDAGRDAFVAALAAQGVSARLGGRYLTLSFGGTKADRMAELATSLGRTRMVALGDAPNDAEMLTTADIGVVIANPHGPGLPELPGEAAGRIRRSTKTGPAGWNEMILPLVSDQADTPAG
ncbi:HAD hydrolase family protein [Pseudooceanicola sp. 216_PA32_1]|uniref:HAD hydrolase family protein n=1 Tax=Pseudooceanicola pacificus TaxID=2676438 RepID=A0A844WG01_9RHOB|nr:HAD-IIB family hydrolase [Pseudooceanicola pacificus]MWB78629.1 HAD hydrolase family protein [Pseudooceanicola pacificus]